MADGAAPPGSTPRDAAASLADDASDTVIAPGDATVDAFRAAVARMTSDLVAVHPETNAASALSAVRERAHDGEFPGYVYVTGDGGALLGVAPLYRLVFADPATRIADFMIGDPVSVRDRDDQE